MTVETDERLIQRMALGDEGALLELHRRYAPHLTAAVHRLLKREDDVHRHIETTFVEAWKTASRFDPARLSGKSWLVAITLHLLSDHCRFEGSPRLTPNQLVRQLAAQPR